MKLYVPVTSSSLFCSAYNTQQRISMPACDDWTIAHPVCNGYTHDYKLYLMIEGGIPRPVHL
jgi:hypothetical protein